MRGRGLVAARLAIAAGILVALVLAVPGSAFAASPHASAVDQSTCSACHVPHQAATASGIFKDVGPVKGENPLCYTCHDGSAASSNIKTGSDSFAYGNGHILEGLSDTSTAADLTNSCSSCHKPHGDPALKPKLPASKVNSATVGTTGNVWCLACHDDAQSWYAKRGIYPALATPTRDASGYPTVGTFAGASVYTSSTANAHISIPATASAGTTRTAGDCLYCHNAHGSASRYDSLSATLAPSTAASVASDRETGAYAALCFGCHGGGSWEASGAANIKQYVTDDAADTSALASGGHRIKSPGGTLPVDAPLPCYDCHNPHGSSRGNKRLISDALGGSLDTSAGPESVRRFCLTCHVTSDSFGWDSVSATYSAPPATSTVEGLKRDGGADGSGPGGVGKNLLYLKVTPGHARADASTSCYECHGSSYASSDSKNVHDPGAYSVALHTGTPTAAAITILGVSYPSQVCATCHSLELGAEHAKPTSSSNASGCAECHPNPRSTLTPSWDRSTCAQAGCHTVASSAPMHSNVSTDHVAPANSCTGPECHSGAGSLAALHSSATTTVAGVTRTSCAVCHAAGVPTSGVCSNCHDTANPHGDDATLHNATLGAGNVAMSVAPWDPDHGADWSFYIECSYCHYSNLVTQHQGACSTCHAGANVAGSIGTWNKTCQQGGCHPTFHSSMTTDHNGAYWNSSASCDQCHDNNWDVSCDACHTYVDQQPPSSYSNALPAYVGPARITLSASDPYPSSGVSHYYSRLDGAAVVDSSTIDIAPPAIGSQVHTIEFWAADNVGLVESTHHSATFTVTKDTQAPATTSDAKASYSGIARIKLTATDNATQFGVRYTYYILDGGAQTAGTSITIPNPSSSTPHTLEFWSVDWSGNVEGHHIASFTCTPDTTPPTTTLVVGNSPTYLIDGRTWLNFGRIWTSLYATDVGDSGVAYSYGILDGTYWFGGASTGALTTASESVSWFYDGPHTLDYWSIDAAGNTEATKHFLWGVDTAAPSVTTDVGTHTSSSNPYVGTAHVTITATDAGSGPKETAYQVDGGTLITAGPVVTVSVAPPASGTVRHTITWTAKDKMDHTTTGSVYFYVKP